MDTCIQSDTCLNMTHPNYDLRADCGVQSAYSKSEAPTLTQMALPVTTVWKRNTSIRLKYNLHNSRRRETARLSLLNSIQPGSPTIPTNIFENLYFEIDRNVLVTSESDQTPKAILLAEDKSVLQHRSTENDWSTNSAKRNVNQAEFSGLGSLERKWEESKAEATRILSSAIYKFYFSYGEWNEFLQVFPGKVSDIWEKLSTRLTESEKRYIDVPLVSQNPFLDRDKPLHDMPALARAMPLPLILYPEDELEPASLFSSDSRCTSECIDYQTFSDWIVDCFKMMRTLPENIDYALDMHQEQQQQKTARKDISSDATLDTSISEHPFSRTSADTLDLPDLNLPAAPLPPQVPEKTAKTVPLKLRKSYHKVQFKNSEHQPTSAKDLLGPGYFASEYRRNADLPPLPLDPHRRQSHIYQKVPSIQNPHIIDDNTTSPLKSKKQTDKLYRFYGIEASNRSTVLGLNTTVGSYNNNNETNRPMTPLNLAMTKGAESIREHARKFAHSMSFLPHQLRKSIYKDLKRSNSEPTSPESLTKPKSPNTKGIKNDNSNKTNQTAGASVDCSSGWEAPVGDGDLGIRFEGYQSDNDDLEHTSKDKEDGSGAKKEESETLDVKIVLQDMRNLYDSTNGEMFDQWRNIQLVDRIQRMGLEVSRISEQDFYDFCVDELLTISMDAYYDLSSMTDTKIATKLFGTFNSYLDNLLSTIII